MGIYLECVKEKYGLSGYQDESCFFTLSINYEAHAVVVEEFFIRPKFRTEKKVREVLGLIYSEAKKHDVSNVIVSVYLKAKNELCDATMYFSLKNGFSITHATPTHIYLKREV